MSSFRPWFATKRMRRGSVLIVSMVILLLVGLLSAQTIRSLAILNQSQSHRAKLRQAKAVIELALAIVEQQRKIPAKEIRIEIGDQTASIIFQERDVRSAGTEDSYPDAVNSLELGYSVIVKFPADAAGEVTMTGSGKLNSGLNSRAE